MTNSKMITQAALILFAAFFLVACGNSGSADNAAVETESTTIEATTPAPAADAVAEDGPEYTSAYICPMHCKGSGSDVAGKCPVCGMDYVVNENATGAGDGHEGHDHDDHEGHNH